MMNKDNRNDKIRKIAKKGLTLSLCAVLAGGLAAGSFEGVNKLAGWSGATTVEAASNKDETTLTYAKSEKKDADASDSKSDTGKDTDSTAKGNLDVSEIRIRSTSIYCIYYNQVSSGGTELLRNVWNVWICTTAAGTGSRGQWFRYYCW